MNNKYDFNAYDTILNLLPETTGYIVDGTITLDGEAIIKKDKGGHSIPALADSDMQKIRGDKVAMIFQDPMTALSPITVTFCNCILLVRSHGRTTLITYYKTLDRKYCA